MAVSIVVVNWNSGSLLEGCVRSLLEHARGCEIIVVDNASEDASLDFPALTAGPVKLFRNDSNLGYAAGNNVGWRQSSGTEILFLNPDTECLPQSVDCLREALGREPGVWAAGGQLVGPAGVAQAAYGGRPFPSVGSVAAAALFLDRIWPVRRHGRAQGGEVDQPAAACLMVSRAALERTGGFDERFFPAWFEDVDLCRRIRDCGGRIRFEPAARFAHLGGYSARKLPRARLLAIYHRNQILYFRKHHGERAAARVRALVLTGLLLRSLGSLIRPPGRDSRIEACRAYGKAARHIAAGRGDA